jgi:hypothetical protein
MHLLLGLEVVEKNGAFLGLFTPVLDDDARAVDDLASIAIAVDLACSYCISIPNLSSQSSNATYTNQPIHRAAFHQGP